MAARYPCEHEGCDKVYAHAASLRKHMKEIHEGVTYLCEHEGCDKIFTAASSLRRHIRSIHEGVRYPCEYEGCDKTFKDPRGRRYHIRASHEEGVRYPCEYEGCDMTFKSREGRHYHIEASHKEGAVRYPCEYEGCDKTYESKSGLRNHIKSVHEGVRYPCEYEGCDKTFTTISYLHEHTRLHNLLAFPCLRPYCKDRFATARDAWDHTWGESHTLAAAYICPKHHTCPSGISKRRFDEKGARNHWLYSHATLDVATPGAECLREMIPSCVPPWGGPGRHSLFFHLLREYAVSKYQLDANSLNILDKPNLPNPDDIKRNLSALQKSIYIGNVGFWRDNKHDRVSFSRLGLHCIGPCASSFDEELCETCPLNTVIDFDTARFNLHDLRDDTPLKKKTVKTLGLSSRCVHCSTLWVLRRCINPRMTLDTMSDDGICDAEACNNRTLSGLNKCLEHVHQMALDWHTNQWTGSLPALEAVMQIAMRKQWTYPHDYQAIRDRVQEIQDGKRPSSDLVILDNEFSPSSQQPFEIAIIDRVYGRTLIDTLVKHPEGLHLARDPHRAASNNLSAPFKELMSQRIAKKFNSMSGPSIRRMDVHEVASELQKVGISKESVFLVYHQSKIDLSILRNFLATGGYSDILPSNNNCIPLLKLFRHQQLPAPPGFRFFPLKLEIIFPLLYPRHELCGRNHRALVDCQQTMLVLDKFDSLCNPVESRGSEWQPRRITTISQRQITDFFNREKEGNEKHDRTDGRGESGDLTTVTEHAVAKTDDEGDVLMVIEGNKVDDEN